jgi:hypothetical protein
VLAYGDDVFEPELWLASATESPDRTTAQWSAATLGGLAYLDYRHFEQELAPDEVAEYFDDGWFETTFSVYDSWKKVGVCYSGDNLTLHKFNLTLQNTEYAMRYWVEQVSPMRVMALFVLFPSADPTSLDDYAARLYPKLPDCLR